MRNDEADHLLLILQELLDLIDSIKPLSFTFNILGLVLVIVVLLANEQLLLEALLGQLSLHSLTISNLVTSAWRLVLALACSTLRFAGILLVLFGKMLTHFEC
tara:strand:- start:131 stop:439 length:309 start_codon:yes stop_codon:yes gene_type:complete